LNPSRSWECFNCGGLNPSPLVQNSNPSELTLIMGPIFVEQVEPNFISLSAKNSTVKQNKKLAFAYALIIEYNNLSSLTIVFMNC
jgi:hypothetical protein